MRKLILVAALVATGCETTHHPTVPTALEMSEGPSVAAEVSVPAQQGTFVSCPGNPPFAATIGVVITAGSTNVFLTSITSQFVDRNRINLPAITLSAPIPTAQFGSNLVAARSTFTFPVNVRFGCGTASTGTILMTVLLTDANGVEFVRNLSVNVR